MWLKKNYIHVCVNIKCETKKKDLSNVSILLLYRRNDHPGIILPLTQILPINAKKLNALKKKSS